MGSAPSGEVRIVRTLTSRILDWKERISERMKAWQGGAHRAQLET
jgi:hypothetical protein